jgi:hypothetical protein
LFLIVSRSRIRLLMNNAAICGLFLQMEMEQFLCIIEDEFEKVLVTLPEKTFCALLTVGKFVCNNRQCGDENFKFICNLF